LRWARHLGHRDGSFQWQDFQTVGTGWSDFTHVFSGDDGVIYAIERVVDAGLSQDGKVKPASGGRLRWARHVGHQDGTFRWEDFKTVGTGWGDFTHVFWGGDGVIYAIERVVEAGLSRDGEVKPASGGRLRWARHLGHQDGTFRWEDFKTVGTGWGDFTSVFATGDGVIYAIERVVEAGLSQDGGVKPASGGRLRWARHLGHRDGTFRWEDFKTVGTGWGDFTHVFPGGDARGMEDPAGRICHFLDAPGTPQIGIRSYLLKSHGRASSLTWSFAENGTLNVVNGTMSNADLLSTLAAAFDVWTQAVPALQFTRVAAGGDIVIRVGDLGVDPVTGNGTLGETTEDGSQITLNNNFAVTFVPTLPGRNSLLSVAAHEIGHAIGILHSTTPGTLMYPFGGAVEALADEDTAAARALYAWTPQREVKERGTDSSPALCVCGPWLVMAWKGIAEDDRVLVSRTLDGVNWTPQRVVPDAGSADGPALAWDGTTLWLAFRGVPDDDGLYWATSTDLGETWSSVTPIGGVGSLCSPSLTVAGGAPLMVWRGIPGDDSLYYATWQNGWANQQRIGGTGSEDRPSICVGFDNLPRAVWRGVPGDDSLYTSTLIGQFWQPQQQLSWVVAGNGPQGTVDIGVPGSIVGPTVTNANNRILLAWQGVPGDDGIYFTQAAPGPGGQPSIEWSSQALIESVGTSQRPAIVLFMDAPFLAWKGARDDHTIYTTRQVFRK
jgi:hypothetical protein